LVEEPLLVRFGADLGGCRRLAGGTASRLIEQIDREAASEEQGTKPSRPSGVVSQQLESTHQPCQNSSGSGRASTGIWNVTRA
jgi:hypothetical protein